MDPFVLLLVMAGLLIAGLPIGKILIIVGVIGCLICVFFMLVGDDTRLASFLLFGVPSIICLIIGLNNESLLLYEIFF